SDQELVLYRGRNIDDASQILMVSPATVNPTPIILRRLEHEYSLRQTLDPAWSARPITMASLWDRPVLVLGDPGGVPLDQLLGPPLDLPIFLRLGINLSSAIDELHRRKVIHKDIKPANVLANSSTGQCWLTGFGISSLLPRERQSAEAPEVVAGTLAYMAPEQTGRMNRSIDSRSDLYSLGVTLYQMLTGTLPFAASDPMEWVHCHIARQPVPANERSNNAPTTVSAIIMKLLAKTAEDRYQTASGVKNDLERCLLEWESRNSIAEFALGERDIPDRILVPEKLYGRAPEIDTLLAAFERVVASGRPELVLVSGYSGIGKSSVVHELHKVLVPRGLFASGKFDQYKRDIPYSTLAQAFQGLVRMLLLKSDAELSQWRDALRKALDPTGQLIVNLVPELALILGEQPPVPELPPQDAQRRFQAVFRRFINVFARPEHPLALFLDDLQWLDAATLDLLADLLRQPDVQHLMLIGAYRDNEVSNSHPLMRMLEDLRQTGAVVHELVLAPLSSEDLGRLIADALHYEAVQVARLAQLVYQRTAGNPFFALQFITALAEEELVRFDRDSGRWTWDLSRIQATGYSDNVVDLMIGRLNGLPAKTQKALQELACLGNSADITTLSIVHGNVLRSEDGEQGLVVRSEDRVGGLVFRSQDGEGGTAEEKVHADLWEALRLEFIVRSEDYYRFVHDRVQEAAYSLIPDELRAETHLQIGRLLMANVQAEKREESIFEIVNQLNRGALLISERDEREQLAELNLMAGKRAKASTAYSSALKYLTAGAALLADDRWEPRHELSFALEFYQAECEFLTGKLAAAEERLQKLSSRAGDTVELATVGCLRVDLYMTLDQSDRAVDVCLDYLRYLDVEWSAHPTSEEARHEYDRIWAQLGSRSIEELIDLPLMSDSEALATLDVLTKVFPAALHTNANLASLAICKAVNLSLERGNSDGSCFAYVWLGMIAGPHFDNYDAGFRFGRLGYELVGKRGLKRFQARTYMCFGNHVVPWNKHVRDGRDLVRQAFDVANDAGDLTYAAFSCNNLNTNLLAAGDPLLEVHREAEHGMRFAEKAHFGHVVAIITAQLGLVRTLLGLTRGFGSFDDLEFDELRFERHLAGNPVLALPECLYWIRKLQARFLAGDYATAVDSSSNAQRLLWTTPHNFEAAEYHFYSALARSAVCDTNARDNQDHDLLALAEHHEQLALWAKNCPENFATRAALVGAEIARIEGRDQDAMRLYEQAIESARVNGFVNNEAVANEVAARFYAARGFKKIAHTYLRDARYCYRRWGANGKVRQLDEFYPQLREEEPLPGPTTTIGASVEQLDLATVIKVSQTVSGEIVLKKLIDTLMRTAIEHAGAERGLLILTRDDEQSIEAEAMTSGDTVIVRLREAPAQRASARPEAGGYTAEAELPESIIHYVVRTQENVVLDDAAGQNAFSADPYLRRHNARSILCLPLINQAKLIGVLYLENNLTPHVFTPKRIAVLRLLASQAAISLENTRLYRDLEIREAKIRRLVDSNIIGIHIWNLEGEIIEANEAFLRMLGYSRADLISGRMRWTERTPAEWTGRDQHAVSEIVATGIFQPFEKEYFRKDGSRVPVLMGGAVFEGSGNEGVAFVLDLSRQKSAEEALQKAQTELAHASRVMTMGELTASIAHEISQPITAIITNANVGLRWLRRDVPDLEETAQAIRRIGRDGERAGAVLSRMRALFKKTPTAKEPLDINEVIQEVLTITQHELQRHRVSVRTQFANDLPPVTADRVQMQQVVLNLVVNAIQAMSAVVDGPRELQLTSRAIAGLDDERANDSGVGVHSIELTQVLVTIRDSGPGLDAERLSHLFDPFFSTKAEGLGIGLTVSRSIIEAHRGRLWAKANAPQGAIFQFTLPI
ncbi:MAG: AAA family ATPase, partial [Verrucomicrobia bacterium]|nr:AAA family ATPase [Verrucomicrobiota bacterium]